MSNDTYEINEHDEVVPYNCGRRSNDTRTWRDATELELSQRDKINALEARVEELEADIAVLSNTEPFMRSDKAYIIKIRKLTDLWDDCQEERNSFKDRVEELEARKVTPDMLAKARVEDPFHFACNLTAMLKYGYCKKCGMTPHGCEREGCGELVSVKS